MVILIELARLDRRLQASALVVRNVSLLLQPSAATLDYVLIVHTWVSSICTEYCTCICALTITVSVLPHDYAVLQVHACSVAEISTACLLS